MDLNQKFQVKLAPLNGVAHPKPERCEDQNRLRGGCTNLMYACQQGLTDTIVKEVRKQVNRRKLQTHTNACTSLERQYLAVNYTLLSVHKLQVSRQRSD